MRVGIIGCGVIAAVHRKVIESIPEAELAAVCDIDPGKRKANDGVPFYTDADEMLGREKLDCVHICLPHDLHVPAALMCAGYGCNVFLEKPVGLNEKQVGELYGAEEKYNVKIGVCLQNRYNPTTVYMKKLTENHESGRFLGSRGIVTWHRDETYYGQAPWRGIFGRSGGGVMINQALHTLDLLTYIGGKISSIDGKTANFSLKGHDIEDSVMARMRYAESDACAVFFATVGYCEDTKPLLEFAFENAIYRISDGKLYGYDGGYGNGTCLCDDGPGEPGKGYYGSGHYAAIKHFYRAIERDTKDYISVRDAAEVIKLIDGIAKSSRSDSTVRL